ncbi:MAG: hypothetical protein JXA77_05020 [Bacteroidales bacterium]|nr:hypothetical protein [Bacteroidales bacterium]MBN2820409.1 hypothetical protein [Bacteroidales bacterium]
MEKETAQKAASGSEKTYHHIDRVNLYDFGYEKSGSVKGDPQIFKTYLDRIGNGDLVEEAYIGLSDEEKNERKNQIRELESLHSDTKKLNEKFEKEVKEKEKQIEDHRNELLNISEKHKKDFKALKKESFSPLKFGVNLFILLFLSCYLFFFYVSAAYKALYTDLEGIAEQLIETGSIGSIMPQPYELSEAIRYNFLLFLVPFVFYAFGWAFHIMLEIEKKIKFLYIGLLIAVTFTVDFLLAIIIHTNTESAKEFMGLTAVKWSANPTFYIILFLGFLVYMVWSILLDSMIREWEKRGITVNLKRIIKHLRKDIKVLQSKITDTSGIEAALAQYREDISTVMVGNLKRYVDQFTNGWVSYLAPENMKGIKASCLQVKKEYEDKMGIRPGIIKVISKRNK